MPFDRIAVARQIRARVQALRTAHGPGAQAQQRLFEQLAADESLRVQVLRFVDVFPALGDDAELIRHLHEYFRRQSLPLPGFSRWLLAGNDAVGGLRNRAVARLVRGAMAVLARRFVGGDSAASAFDTLSRLRGRGLGFTLDWLGEASLSETECDACRDRYLQLIDALAPMVATWPADALADSGPPLPVAQPRLHLSIKVSALYSQIDPVDAAGSVVAICERLRPIALAARRQGAALCLDMEQYAYKALVLTVFRQLFMEPGLRDWPHASIAIQAYLRDTADDLEALLGWVRERGTPVSVRLVRGAYWDQECVVAAQQGWPLPVWRHKAGTDLNYEHCSDWLIAHGDWLRPMIASHNLRSLVVAMAQARQHGLRRELLEFQLLYGIGDALAVGIRDQGYRTRLYVPCGELLPGMAYLVRRLLENSSNQAAFQLGGFGGAGEPALADLLAEPRVSAETRGDLMAVGQPPEESAAGFRNQSPRAFHHASARERFAQALHQTADALGGDYPMWLDGRPVESARWLLSRNPARPRQCIGRVAVAAAEHVDQAVDIARQALPGWRDRGMQSRAAVLRDCASALQQQRDEFAAWVVFEAGKGWREADAEVCEAIDFLQYYADSADALAQGGNWSRPGEDNRGCWWPRGVAVVISPWNFPLAITIGMTAAALVTGNSVVLKPSSRTPVVAARLVVLLHAAGIPGNVLQYLPGRGSDIGDRLVTHPAVDLIAFTGSLAVGSHILDLAARQQPGRSHFRQVLAEMGGKNAIIVDADADLDEAVAGVISSAFAYQGQKCSACSRVVVVGSVSGSVLAAFSERLIAAAASLRCGDPLQPGNTVGPVIDARAAAALRKAIDAARYSARLLFQAPGEGNMMGPVIVDRVAADSKLATEELFGPVLALFAADNFQHALAIANQCRYALAGGVYSRSPAHLQQAREQFEVGNLYLNRGITGALVGHQPFGGYRLSGLGDKAGGPETLLRYMLSRTITENSLRRGFAPPIEPL